MTDHPEAVSRFPLAWPVGWVRTPYGRRQIAKFTQTTQTMGAEGPRYRTGHVSVFVATQRLEAQLDKLGAQDPILSTNVPLRLDGRPRSETDPADVGVAVYFRFKGKATVMACDRWTRVADNIAAIAAHVDALRRIERYGIGTIEQALAGYKALPADTAAAWRIVFGFSAQEAVSDATLDSRYKALAKKAHPDVIGGSDAAFMHLGRALEFARADLRNGQ